MKLYLIRHGQTDWNVAGKIQGSQNTELNNTGIEQAKCLAAGMKERHISRIYSSMQKRAVQTADIIGRSKGIKVTAIAGLEEIDFGKWEGLTLDEIKAAYPKEYNMWKLNPVEVSPPGGENQIEVLKRCAGVIKKIMSESFEDAAIVSHGATLAHMITYMLKDEAEEEIIVNNASITTVNYSPLTQDFMLMELNDTSHLHS